jgi:hypothetical protein
LRSYVGGTITNATFVGNTVTGAAGGNAGTAGDGGQGPAGNGPNGTVLRGGTGADAQGGGIYYEGAGTQKITNVTVDGNTSTGGALGQGMPAGGVGNGNGGGMDAFGVILGNSIVAQNSARLGSPTGPDCGGSLTTGGHNLIGAIDGCNGIVAGVNGDIAGTSTSPLNPALAPLGHYGGTTLTMAEKPGSRAIRQGSAATCQSAAIGDKDQRGYPRLSVRRGSCDAGAYDSAEPEKLVVAAPTGATRGAKFSITVTAADPFGNTVTSFADGVRFTSTDRAAVLPPSYTFTSADKGKHTFTVTLNTAGAQIVTVLDTRSSLIRGGATVSVT